MTTNKEERPVQPSLFFQSHNEKGAETILLIHGACGSSKEWDKVIPHLTDQNYHVLAPDLPMHGQSVSIKPFNLNTATSAILHIISAHAKNGTVHLVGLSLGAHIGACIAERAVPGQISSAILSGYNTLSPPKMLMPLIMPSIFMLHHTVQMLTEFPTEMRHLRTGQSSYGLIYEVIRTLCEPRPLGKIPVRTLVVAAQKDSLLQKDSLDSAKKLFAAVDGGKEGGSRVVLHRGILHAWHMFEPVLFGEMVVQWVGGKDVSSDFEDIE
jgi:pimeloyl-ACP methyl ester carboxylesterase